MKVWNSVLKFLAALAAVAGIAYVAMNYGDQIVAWVKRKLNQYGLCCCELDEDFLEEEIPEEPSEEAPAEELAEEADFETE